MQSVAAVLPVERVVMWSGHARHATFVDWALLGL